MQEHENTPQPVSADEPLAIAQRDLGDAHADLHHVQSAVLREGPRSKKTARYVAVKNRHAGEVHHHALTLETGKKRQGSWELDDKRSISFSDEDDDEIARLLAFLHRVRPGAEPAAEQDVVAALLAIPEDAEALKGFVRTVRERPDAFAAIGAAIAFGRHAQAVEKLKKLLAADDALDELCALLRQHLWLLGSEYGEPVAQEGDAARTVLHRSSAGRLQVALVRTPHAAILFEGDAPSAERASALGEAIYLADAWPPGDTGLVTVLIGSGLDELQRGALRRLNARLRGIEVLSYDELLKRAQRVLERLRATAKGEESR